MNVKHLLDDMFPYGTTEATCHVSVSNENFKDVLKRVFGNKGLNRKHLQTWMDSNLTNPSSLTVTAGEFVEIGSRHAAFFYREEKPVVNVIKAAMDDLTFYKGLFQKYRSSIKRNVDELKRIKREHVELAISSDVEFEDVLKAVESWEGRIKKGPSAQFHEPKKPLLGYGTQPFTKDGRFIGISDKIKRKEPVGVPTLGQRDIGSCVNLIKELLSFSTSLTVYVDNNTGIELSDSPLGDFSELLNGSRNFDFLYAQPTFENENTDLYYNIGYRCLELAFAVTAYLKLATE